MAENIFVSAAPCEVGISAKCVKKYISVLEKYGLSTHSLIMARGNKIFFEKYWEPFNKDFPHRMYSVTKSFVAIAIGFLIEENLVSLDDKISKYFADDIPDDINENVKNQTVRDMLMMSTGFSAKNNDWFSARVDDRVKYYFESSAKKLGLEDEPSRIPGTFFEYDSNGSFILGAMVERISGKSLKDYLQEKLFSKIGVETVKILKCPGGHSWGDSALICTPLDMLKVARFTLNYGNWQGEQILSADYLKEATGKRIDNSIDGNVSLDRFGYGYQFWRTWQDSFFFNGMGCQLMVCVPHKDLIMVYNGDNQGNILAKSIIIDRFFDEIVDNMCDEIVTDDAPFETELKEYTENLKLCHACGDKTSPIVSQINGKTYVLGENRMGIKTVKFEFCGDEGNIEYTNCQGKKVLPFGMCKNVFTLFPQEDYSDEIGSKKAKGNLYKCASSAAWVEERKLGISVQVIDEYFGRLFMSFCFKEDKTIALQFTKCAEDFFNEYYGYADGVAEG